MNPSDLTENDRKLLEQVTQKDLISLTSYDMAVLQARRDYLTGPQKEYFADILTKKLTFDEIEETKPETPKVAKPESKISKTDTIVTIEPEPEAKEEKEDVFAQVKK